MTRWRTRHRRAKRRRNRKPAPMVIIDLPIIRWGDGDLPPIEIDRIWFDGSLVYDKDIEELREFARLPPLLIKLITFADLN